MLGRDMKTTLIIDNLESNFKMHSENGILIKSWYHDSSDQILLKLESLLIKIAKEYG
jgi:TFIIF-interacting CTD phosphatase-like protein